MSLKAFHVFFIAVSIVFTAWLSVWCFLNTIYIISVLSTAAMVGLIVYLISFLKKWRSLSYMSLIPLLFLLPKVSWACPVCFGGEGEKMTEAAGMGIAFLLVVICSVLSTFGGLFLYWMRRAKNLPQ